VWSGRVLQLVEYEKSLFGAVTLDAQKYEDDRFGDIKMLEIVNPQERGQSPMCI
jgi:hypothetical protein